MSNASSAVTYTSVYTDSEPWRYYGEESAEAGSPRVIVYGYDGLPMQPGAPPSPDYVPGPEHPPSPDYIPGTLRGPTLPDDASPTAASPGYVADSDPEEDPKDDHADYPVDGGNGDNELSDDDDDDDDTGDEDEEPFEDEDDDEEEEEHLALTESSIVPIVDPIPPAGDTEAFETDESTPTHSGYGITDTWDEIVDTLMEIAPTTLMGVHQRVTELNTTVRQRNDEFKVQLEEAQDDRALWRARVNTLFRDRPNHRRTAMLLDREVMNAHETLTALKIVANQVGREDWVVFKLGKTS
nr:hypothetical protein [Tanacetum cinerariifolium]